MANQTTRDEIDSTHNRCLWMEDGITDVDHRRPFLPRKVTYTITLDFSIKTLCGKEMKCCRNVVEKVNDQEHSMHSKHEGMRKTIKKK